MKVQNVFATILRIRHGVLKGAGLVVVLFGLFVATSCTRATAQMENSLRFHIPFAFMAGDQQLPAGEYRLTRPEPRVLTFQCLDTTAVVTLSTKSFYPNESEVVSHPQLVFYSYGDVGYVLTTVQPPGDVQFNVIQTERVGQMARNETQKVTILAE